ncbi:unnamed protein product [Arabidopsis arenosa]|uniref:F-box protein At3g26010-like beta-propeller domain-containing protein n=1 Tax=Arabidopsis arenosa TaxID=38785 RepID=A0A8S2ADD4_ARAAE|nr:unnamed protein product [Arabidopsis arenosa]
MYIHSQGEVVGYYACKIWGLPRTLGFYISSLIREKFEYEFHHQRQRVKVEAYTDVGLILIRTCLREIHIPGSSTYFVANPISRQCLEIPPPPTNRIFKPAGLATRIQNDVFLASDYDSPLPLRLALPAPERAFFSFVVVLVSPFSRRRSVLLRLSCPSRRSGLAVVDLEQVVARGAKRSFGGCWDCLVFGCLRTVPFSKVVSGRFGLVDFRVSPLQGLVVALTFSPPEAADASPVGKSWIRLSGLGWD